MSTDKELEARVTVLKRGLLRWKRLTLTTLAALAALLLVGWHQVPPASTTVQAQRFVLVDAAGKTRGEWTVGDGPSLSLLALDGRRVAMLQSSDKQGTTGLLIKGPDEEHSGLLSADQDGAMFDLQSPFAEAMLESSTVAELSLSPASALVGSQSARERKWYVDLRGDSYPHFYARNDGGRDAWNLPAPEKPAKHRSR